MTVGILVISHAESGASLIAAGELIIGELPLPLRWLAVYPDDEPEVIYDQACRLKQEVDQGAGVLVVTDLFGATPNNIARRLYRPDRVRVVAGMNLSMLLRVMNYPGANLAELVDKAVSGGRDAVVECCPFMERE